MKLVYLAISLFLLNLFNAFLNFFIVDFVSVDICECAAGDCVGGSRGTCFTRDHLGNPRQPPQRVWSRISHRSTHILFSCGQTCSNADASTRGKANLILQSNSSSWMERFWPLCLNFVFFFSFFKDQFSLEQICGGSVFASHDKCINMLVNFILPLCIRLGCARKGIESTHFEFQAISFSHNVIFQLWVKSLM